MTPEENAKRQSDAWLELQSKTSPNRHLNMVTGLREQLRQMTAQLDNIIIELVLDTTQSQTYIAELEIQVEALTHEKAASASPGGSASPQAEPQTGTPGPSPQERRKHQP